MIKIKPKFSLDHYKFSPSTKKQIEPTIKLIEEEQYSAAEKCFAKKAIFLIKGIDEGRVGPKEADSVFTLLDVYISDNFEVAPFDDVLFDLLMEGMILHHYNDGTDLGPDLNQMEQMARDILDE